jgi:hypothetical protein
VTVAFRLSTVGRDVLDGNGLGVAEGKDVSVAGMVDVAESVWVAVGALRVAVSVTGENAVFVADSAFATVVGVKVDVELQANDTRVRRVGRINFRLIR